MTISGFSGPACREIRQLLGVYVVGAIDPAERAIVDEHLGQCQLCRDELAGLAGLPAMLSRVPAGDVEWLDMAPAELPVLQEPSDELLASLLRKVSVKRRSRLWRSAVAVAAAAVIAAGGAAATVQLTSHPQVSDVATGANGHVSAVVDYSPTAWGTAMRVKVAGIPSGTTCKLWVVGKDGRPSYAGTWTVRGGSYGQAWYSASSPVASGSVHGFRITTGATTLLKFPAT
jgi:predicted anti-sigma-YlaC factor YlaD